MVKKQLLYRTAAATVLGLSLATGAASAAVPHQHYNNHHHGDSHQMPTHNSVVLSSTNQQNNVSASNTASQVAQSGDATVTGNWKAGGADAQTGNARNDSELTKAQVVVQNKPVSNGSGVVGNDEMPVSGDVNTNTVVVTSTNQQNNVAVSNNVNQYASTGDAVVAHNGKGGDATTGNASNKSTASFDVTVTN